MPIDYERWSDTETGESLPTETETVEQIAQLCARVDQLAHDLEVSLHEQAICIGIAHVWGEAALRLGATVAAHTVCDSNALRVAMDHICMDLSGRGYSQGAITDVLKAVYVHRGLAGRTWRDRYWAPVALAVAAVCVAVAVGAWNLLR